MPLKLRNPHSVLAALETRPDDVLNVRIASRKAAGAWETVCQRAHQHRISVIYQAEVREGRRKQRSEKTGRVGIAEATVKERAAVSIEELLAPADDNKQNGLWLAFDQIQDPHNTGAIFRTAAFFGVKGIVLTKDRSAPLSATVYDVASGGMEYVPFSVQTNLTRTLEKAKENGIWILGTSEHTEKDIKDVPRDRPWLLVVGNEEKGIRQLTKDTCDEMCRLTPRSPVSSLNVSVAAGILIAELSS